MKAVTASVLALLLLTGPSVWSVEHKIRRPDLFLNVWRQLQQIHDLR